MSMQYGNAGGEPLPDPVKKAFEKMACPDQEILAFSFDGWYIFGGEKTEPEFVKLEDVYISALTLEGGLKAQDILDKARRQCGDLRLAMKARGISNKQRQEMQTAYDKLNAELAKAREAKKELLSTSTNAEEYGD